MGHLGLVSASELGAVYNPVTQVLTLSASGEAQNLTYGFRFERLAWLGGLRFELLAWTGPIEPGKRPFTHSQDFTIPSIIITDPSNNVTFVTANDPKGKVVSIKWLGYKPPSAAGSEEALLSTFQDNKSSSGEKPAPPPQTFNVASPPTINVLFRDAFNIAEGISIGPEDGMNIIFDTHMLTLTKAYVANGMLEWTFNSLQTGDTQVVITKYSGPGALIMRKVYNVNIFVLDAVSSPAAAAPKAALLAASSNGNGASNGSNGLSKNGSSNGNGVVSSSSSSQPDSETTSFLGRVFEAQRIAQGALPSARLLRAQAAEPSLPGPPPAHFPDFRMLAHLDVLFVGDNNKYVTVRSIGWGQWAPPQVKDGPSVLGLRAFDLNSVKFDLEETGMGLHGAGFKVAPFWEVTLAEPFGNPEDGPYDPVYSFRMGDTRIVNVSAVTGKVVAS